MLKKHFRLLPRRERSVFSTTPCLDVTVVHESQNVPPEALLDLPLAILEENREGGWSGEHRAKAPKMPNKEDNTNF